MNHSIRHCPGSECRDSRCEENETFGTTNGAQDWQMLADLSEALHFPCHIAITTVHPDIIIWSDSRKCVHLVELTVPWEESFEFANAREPVTSPSVLTVKTVAGPAALYPLKLVTAVSLQDPPGPSCQTSDSQRKLSEQQSRLFNKK